MANLDSYDFQTLDKIFEKDAKEEVQRRMKIYFQTAIFKLNDNEQLLLIDKMVSSEVKFKHERHLKQWIRDNYIQTKKIYEEKISIQNEIIEALQAKTK